jgi:hypothetical protein
MQSRRQFIVHSTAGVAGALVVSRLPSAHAQPFGMASSRGDGSVPCGPYEPYEIVGFGGRWSSDGRPLSECRDFAEAWREVAESRLPDDLVVRARHGSRRA